MTARLSILRPEVDDDRLSGRDRPRAHLVADSALAAVGDDHLVGDAAVRREDVADLLLDPLDRERLAVEHEHVAARVGVPEQLARPVHRRLGRALGPADAVQLNVRLHAPPRRELLAIGSQLGCRRRGDGRRARSGRAAAPLPPRSRPTGTPVRRRGGRARPAAHPLPAAPPSRAGPTRGRRGRFRAHAAPRASGSRPRGGRSARGRGTGPGSGPAPRGGARASAACRRRSGRRARAASYSVRGGRLPPHE